MAAIKRRNEDQLITEHGFWESPAASKMSLYKAIPLTPIKDEASYHGWMKNLDILMNLAEKDEKQFNELTNNGEYLETLAKNIESYELENYDIPAVSGVDMLKFLMEQNSLTQSDFADEIGPQGNVSRILKGERQLTVGHISKLCKRFNISADAFLHEKD